MTLQLIGKSSRSFPFTIPISIPSICTIAPNFARCYYSNNANSTIATKNKKITEKLSVAIVGAGPSGFYTAKYLHAAIQKQDRKISLQLDLIDQLPTPFGLVRSGVAPDHPEVKNVQNDFTSLFQSNPTDSDSNRADSHPLDIQFFGNVSVGTDHLSLWELTSLYDVVVLAYGCQSDKKLNIDGEDLEGVLSARTFVAWYNGHPEFTTLGKEISKYLSDNPPTKKVAVIGQGNVALDCARILTKGRPGLYHTDIASHSLPILDNGVKKVTVLGRRGHVQGAFTIKELRELTKLKQEGYDTDFTIQANELDLGATDASLEELKPPWARPKVRIDKLLRDAAATSSSDCEKQICLRFLLNPIRFIPKDDQPTRLGSILCERTRLEGPPHKQVAVGTGTFETIEADMALVSIGYKGILLPELQKDIFDEKRGIITNMEGRVISQKSGSIPEHGLYVSGWLKRGPSGIIGTNIGDAKETVATIMDDLDHLLPFHDKCSPNDSNDSKNSRERLHDLLNNRGIQFINWSEYEMINNAEIDVQRLRSERQPREKLTSVKEMLAIVDKCKT